MLLNQLIIITTATTTIIILNKNNLIFKLESLELIHCISDLTNLFIFSGVNTEKKK